MNDDWHFKANGAALERAFGPAEFRVMRATHSHCPSGSATYAFIAQGPGVKRPKGETEGYVCTSHFRPAAVHEGSVKSDDPIDWD
jgi:hypothetical protein